MKELLGQHAEWRKSHQVSLNRDLILQSPQSEGNKEVQATVLKKENRACKQKTAAASPEMPASIRNQPDCPQVAQRKSSFLSKLVPQLQPLDPDSLQESSPIPRDFVSWDTQASESYQQAGKHTIFPWKAEDGGQRSVVKKGREFASLRF